MSVFGDPGVCAVLQEVNSGQPVDFREEVCPKDDVKYKVDRFSSGGSAVMSEGPGCFLCVRFREIEPFMHAGPLSGMQADASFRVKALDCVCGARAKAALSIKY